MVHKGLDLVLEAFADMPEYHLTVCGPIQKEQDFERAYYRELYQVPNIRRLAGLMSPVPNSNRFSRPASVWCIHPVRKDAAAVLLPAYMPD
jgi:hypothetical protein